MRKVEVRGNTFYLNNKPLFLRTVLDQGFYPDGIYTAPSDEALKKDIELSMSLGFDGARLHQRVFERRFLYWADKLGYIVWGEFADWGLDLTRPEVLPGLRPGVDRGRGAGHQPSVHHRLVPVQRALGRRISRRHRGIFKLTKRLDPTRPGHRRSGGYHQASPDVYDSHNYDQDPGKFKAAFDGLLRHPPDVYVNGEKEKNAPYAGQPYFVSEYGGIWWNPGQKDEKAWGYGDRPKHAGGVPRPLQEADRGPARQPGRGRILLYPALRRRAGGQRACDLRPHAQVRPGVLQEDQPAAGGDREGAATF